MLTLDNDVRIIDFGIALVTDSAVSRIEGIAGSPSYMSPEQVQSAEITPRSDIYSLGAVMYELLTGFRPFRANNLSKLLHQIIYATPPPIHTLRAEISEELEAIVSWRPPATALPWASDRSLPLRIRTDGEGRACFPVRGTVAGGFAREFVLTRITAAGKDEHASAWRSAGSNAERRIHWCAGSLPNAAIPATSRLSGFSRNACFSSTPPPDRRQRSLTR